MLSDPRVMRAALDASPTALMVTGADGTIRWVNDAFTKLTGYSAEEAVGRTPRLLKSGEQDAAFYQALWEGALAGGWEGELLNRRRDGTLYWERQSIAAVRGTGGEISHFIASKLDVTAWRAARERNERLPVAYMAIDAGGRIVEVNRAWLQLLGYTREEALDRSFASLVAPDQAADFGDCLEEFRKIGCVHCIEGVVLHKSGERVPVIVEGQAEYGAGKAFRHGHMTLEDATERRRAERTLRFTQSAVANAPDASYWIARDGRLIYVNDSACTMLGYTRDELLSMTAFDIDPDATAQGFSAIGLHSKQGGAAFEAQHRRKDGTLFPVEINCNLATFDGEEYLCAFVRDISERKRAESALRQSEERFRSLVENAPAAIFVVVAGLFRYVNQAACELLGAESPAQLLGQPAMARVHPDDRQIALDRLEAVERRGSAVPAIEERLLRLDGSAVDVEESASPFDFQGEPGVISFARDIRNRKQAEAERARLAEQLKQSQRLESIGRLAGGVAHDFNNLLTVINGYADLLLARETEGPMRPALEQIRKSGERAAHLTQQLLAFSRRQDAQLRPTDLNAVIVDAYALMERLAGDQVRLTTRLADGLGLVMADAGQIRQALANLVANGREAMPTGGELLVETANLEVDGQPDARQAGVTPGPYVTLRVTDTGCGMDEETRRSAFEPFFTTKDKSQGAGLGLPTVYGIVKQSGGWVHVSSEPGRGAAVTIYLPKLLGGVVRPEPPPPQLMALRGTETILVVEDQEEVRKLALEVLGGYGYQLLEAANGAEALDLAERYSGTIDLLLTDVVMPVMNGRELAERLCPQRPEMKVLYMSGYTEDVMARGGVLDPSLAYLPKPFPPERLAAKVRRTLDAPAPQRA
jgi:two-component system cell cycle sensor histidine kinase/response regulator CckA